MNFKTISVFCFFTLLISSCNSDKNSEKAVNTADTVNPYRDPKNYFKDCKGLFLKAQAMDSLLYTSMEVDKVLAKNAIKAFTDYAYYCQNDSLSPIFLIKTSQVAVSINNIPQARIALEKCVEDYPNFKGITAAIFLLAQLFDNESYLNDEEEARRLYQEIIDKYPKSAEAESAKGALRFIGKTDKEIMETLKKESSNISIEHVK